MKAVDRNAAIVLSLAAFVAHFCLAPSLGLYEDDYSVAGLPLAWSSLLDGAPELRFVFTHWILGRPVGAVISRLLVWAPFQLGGLLAVYFVAFAIVTLVAWRLYRLLRACLAPDAALVGALIYLLHPIDTNKPFLTHVLEFQVAMLAVLGGLLLHQRGRLWLGLVVASLSLVIYETPFALFVILAPFLTPRLPSRRALITHAFRCALPLISVFLLRVFVFDEARALDAVHRFPAIAGQAIDCMIAGPWLSLIALVKVPVGVFGRVPWLGAGLPLTAAVIATALFRARGAESLETMGTPSRVALLFAGLASVVASYGVAFNYYPLVAAGRTTPHLAPVMGASVLGAAAYALVSGRWSSGAAEGRGLLAIVAIYLGSQVLVGLDVQRDLSSSWVAQRNFWREIESLCPDVTKGTLVLVNGRGLPEARYLSSFSWATAVTLQLTRRGADPWNDPPRLIVFPDWTSAFEVASDGRPLLRVPAAWSPAHTEELLGRSVIAIEARDGRLQRLSGAFGAVPGLKLSPPGPPSGWMRQPLTQLGALLSSPH